MDLVMESVAGNLQPKKKKLIRISVRDDTICLLPFLLINILLDGVDRLPVGFFLVSGFVCLTVDTVVIVNV